MKYFIAVIALLLVVVTVQAQTITVNSGLLNSQRQLNFVKVYAKSNFANSGTDTTGWFNIEPLTEVALVFRATDSANCDVYADAKCSAFTNVLKYTTYQDSLTLADSTTGFQYDNTKGLIRNVLLKTTTLNRLNQPANNQVRFRVVQRGAGAGTTSGRAFEVWLVKNNP